jgi:hypothetical protein
MAQENENEPELGFGQLFDEEAVDDEFFSFDDISMHWDQLRNETNITFHYSYGLKRKIESEMAICGRLSSEHTHALFCVGMCVLPWYWMGYGCEKIIISVDVCPFSPKILEFWQTLYSNVLLEYLHSNKSSRLPTLVLSETRYTHLPTAISRPLPFLEIPVLVPIGGDSSPLTLFNIPQAARIVWLFGT